MLDDDLDHDGMDMDGHHSNNSMWLAIFLSLSTLGFLFWIVYILSNSRH